MPHCSPAIPTKIDLISCVLSVAVIDDENVPADVMHKANTTRLCKQHGLYLAPNLNDRLYLQVLLLRLLSKSVVAQTRCV